MAEKTLQERLRRFGKLELAISGKPWTLGEDAATELDRLAAQLKEAQEAFRYIIVEAETGHLAKVQESARAALAATEPKQCT